MTQQVRKSKSFLMQSRPLVPRRYLDSIEDILSKWEADSFRNSIRVYLLVFLDSREIFPPNHGQLQVRKFIWPWGAFVEFQEFWAEIWVWSLKKWDQQYRITHQPNLWLENIIIPQGMELCTCVWVYAPTYSTNACHYFNLKEGTMWLSGGMSIQSKGKIQWIHPIKVEGCLEYSRNRKESR